MSHRSDTLSQREARLVQLVPTCIIIFTSLSFISAECGRQERRSMFNRFSSEVVVNGESQADVVADMNNSSTSVLLKPRRTWFLTGLRSFGAVLQIGLYLYLALHKLANAENGDHGGGVGAPGPGAGGWTLNLFRTSSNGKSHIDEDWPLWLPAMHLCVWLYCLLLSVVAWAHPRKSNKYLLLVHLDIIYCTTFLVGVFHFFQHDFRRPVGLWTEDDRITALSTLVSLGLGFVTLATKPLVAPQPMTTDAKISKGSISPEFRSSLYARIAFTWLHPMIVKAYKGKIEEADIWAMDKPLRLKTVYANFLEDRQGTVLATMVYMFRFSLLEQLLWAVTWAGLGLVPPMVVYNFVQYVQDITTYNRNEAIFYVVILLVSLVLRSAVLQRGLHMSQRMATKAMGMTDSLVLDKVLVRKDMDPACYDIGDLLAVDVKRIGQGWKHSFYVMAYPLMVIFAAAQLYGYIGMTAWLGCLAVCAWYPISAVASLLFSGKFDPTPVSAERSNALIADFLANFRNVKYLNWQDLIAANILKFRRQEQKLNQANSPALLSLVSVPLGADLAQAAVVVFVLTMYSLHFEQKLSPAILFATLVLVDMQTSAINSLPSTMVSLKDMTKSLVRINFFLEDDENELYTVVIRDKAMAERAGLPLIGFVNATFVWPANVPDEEHPLSQDESERSNWIVRALSVFGYRLPVPEQPMHKQSNKSSAAVNRIAVAASDTAAEANAAAAAASAAGVFTLKNLTLSFPPNKVAVVTGTKKSGKTALMMALLGEMDCKTGKVYFPREDYFHGKKGFGSGIAYVGQEPWLEIGGGGRLTGSKTGRSTIRDTILFGSELDEERYNMVIKACALSLDLADLEDGDLTIIGDKNLVWSMSLKQRISLARAVYSNVTHVLLDDSLSFVDAKTRSNIWKNCIMGPLMKDKTRIVATNASFVKAYLNDADYIVGLHEGEVLGHGTFEEVLAQGWIGQGSTQQSMIPTVVSGTNLTAIAVPASADILQQSQLDQHRADASSPPKKVSTKGLNLADYDDLDSTLSREKLAGLHVGWATFGTYVAVSGNVWFLFFGFVCLMLSQMLFVARVGWLGIWAESESWNNQLPPLPELPTSANGDMPTILPTVQIYADQWSNYEYIAVFAGLAGFRSLFLVADVYFMRKAAKNGSNTVYRRLLKRITRARLFVLESAAKVTPIHLGGVSMLSQGAVARLKECFQLDLQGLDVRLAKEFWRFVSEIIGVLLTLVILIATIPSMLVPITGVLFLLNTVAILGLGLSKEMRRLAIKADRMDQEQFSHTFQGLATIRGYGLQRRAIRAGMTQAEIYQKTLYFGAAVDRWINWKVDLFGALIPFSFGCLTLFHIETLNAVWVGLGLYLSLQFNQRTLECLHGFGRIRSRLQWALERARRYSNDLNQPDHRESPDTILAKRPAASWPFAGDIEWTSYSSGKVATLKEDQSSKMHNDEDGEEIVISRNAVFDETALMVNALAVTPQSQGGLQRNTSSVESTLSDHHTALQSTSTIESSSNQSSNATLIPTHVSPVVNAPAPAVVPGPQVPTGLQESPLPPLPPMIMEIPAPPPIIQSTKLASDDFKAPQLGPITCSIRAGEKVAIVGHSKSGKSTLVQSLFRIWETVEEDAIRSRQAANEFNALDEFYQRKKPQKKATTGKVTNMKKSQAVVPEAKQPNIGKIAVDGVNISELGLGDLRSRFAMLSQRGPIFAGTVRFNLDPRGEHDDAELNDVLRTCFLSDRLTLDTELVTPATASIPALFSSTASPAAANSGTGRFSLHSNGQQQGTGQSTVSKNKQPGFFKRQSRRHTTAGLFASIRNNHKARAEEEQELLDSQSASDNEEDLAYRRWRRHKKKKLLGKQPATIGHVAGGKLLGVDAAVGTISATSKPALNFTQGASSSSTSSSSTAAAFPPSTNLTTQHTIDSDGDEDEDDEEEDGRVDLDMNGRQLLCLARILVQRSNIVILDQAASRVTDLTAQRIDQIILQEFEHATVLNVGHRLDQIVSRSDRVLVLEQGVVVEFDTPVALLHRQGGVFWKICQKTGSNFLPLIQVAERTQFQREKLQQRRAAEQAELQRRQQQQSPVRVAVEVEETVLV